MKNFLALAALASALVCSAADAASVSVTQNGDALSLFLDGEGQEFDTVFFRAAANAPATFTNPSSGLNAGVPRPAGEAFTYPNRMLNADPIDFPGGLGLSQFGLMNTPQELSFTVASLGGLINTAPQPNGDLFLANLNLPGAANFSAFSNVTVQTLRSGALVQEINVTVPVPEPATLALAGLGLVGLVAVSRRKA